MQLGQPSIDQLRIFLAVIDEGSFGGAAKRLGRAISAISYGIAQLEALLAMRLFAREGSRRPELTPAGRALLPAARAVAGDMDALLAKARDHHQGLEAELAARGPKKCLSVRPRLRDQLREAHRQLLEKLQELGLLSHEADAGRLGEVIFNNLNAMFIEFVKDEAMTLPDLNERVARQNAPLAALILR